MKMKIKRKAKEMEREDALESHIACIDDLPETLHERE